MKTKLEELLDEARAEGYKEGQKQYSDLMKKLGWLYGAKEDGQEIAEFAEEVEAVLDIAKGINSPAFNAGLKIYKKDEWIE